MPYMELRNYGGQDINEKQRARLMEITRDHLARGQDIDGTFEFRYLPKGSKMDYCEYDYLYVIDMGWSEEREARKSEIAAALGRDMQPILGTESFAVRLRLQNAAFVPYTQA